MATYHLTAKIGAKGKAAAHAAYIAREGKYSGSTRYEDLEATQYGNMPAWAEHNPAEFWQAADDYERANGSAYREIEIALPRELTPPQRLELVQDFVSQELGKKHAYQFAIHTPKAALEKGEQPHAHIMYSERIIDGIERDPEQYFKRYNAKFPERGGNKKASGGKRAEELKAELLATRERWADIQNKHLEKHGHDERVSHLSLEDQGIEDREPEQHLGGSGVRNNAKKRALVELRAANAENAKAHAEAAPIVEQHKAQQSVKDVAKSKAEEFKKRLAEKAQAKAQAEKAERERIEQERIRKEIDQIHAQVAQERAKQQEQQRQAEREQIERTAREEAERKRQVEQQAALDRVAAEKAEKQQQDAQKQAERKAKTKTKSRNNDLEM